LVGIWRWNDWIAAVPESYQVTLGEGETPLVRSRRLGRSSGLRNLYFKLEHANPSGSYKDRFAAAAIAHMRWRNQDRCIATSSGNTGAALAAYCAAAGIACRIAIVETAPLGKLKQMLAYGAELVRVRRFGVDPALTDRVFQRLQLCGAQPGAALQISAFHYSAAGMSGVQTISYELAEQLQSEVDHVFCPAGGGGLCLAVARGFQRLAEAGQPVRAGRVECVQPWGNDTIAGPLRDGRAEARAVQSTTKISGLQVANVIDGHEVLKACRASGGTGHRVDDDWVWEVQQRLAREEGIFAEPAGAVAVAGALQAARLGELRPDARVVCLVTGSGFKDEAALERMVAQQECPVVDEGWLESW
jgi:threonine synthase